MKSVAKGAMRLVEEYRGIRTRKRAMVSWTARKNDDGNQLQLASKVATIHMIGYKG